VAFVPLPSLGRLSSRTNLKAASSGRHRGAAKPADDGVVEDTELTSYLAALAPDADNESTGTGKRFGEAQVFQLRMSLIASQQLKDIAETRGISPQALAQEWILERLNWEGQASSLQDQRQVDAGELTDLTDEFHFPADAFEAPVAGRR
jgi:aryl-alcohol dehydrogenase-like predicted oxidoreductase